MYIFATTFIKLTNNMKLIRLSLCALALSFTLLGCSNKDDDTPEPTIDATRWVNTRFSLKENGALDITPNKVFKSTEDLQSYLVGKGWKHISSYEIKEDGTVKQESFFKDLYGLSPTHYYFNSTTTLTTMYYSDAKGLELVNNTHDWTYIEDESTICINPQVSATPVANIIQILEADESGMWLVKLVATTTSRPVYTVSYYTRMSNNELKKYLL